MAKSTTRKSRAKAKPAPEATQGDAEKSVAAQTAAATTENNPASTTKANDPERNTPEAAQAAADASGTAQAQATGDAGDGGDTPADPNAPAAGDRASHPAQTTAEATAAGAGTSDAPDATIMPAGDDADPNADINQTRGEGDKPESTQDESGAIQEATRRAIGAGYGAPDGISGGGEDPATADAEPAEEIEPVELSNGETLTGRKAKLFRMIEKGATQAEMLEATGSTSVLGTINVLSRRAGRELEAKKGKDGVRVYKLKK